MANVKVSALSNIADANITATDLTVLVDGIGATPTTYSMTMAQMRTAVLTASVGSGWTATDYLGMGAGTVPSTGMIRSGQGSLTGSSSPLINSTATWNNAATTFTHILVNITNTASNAASLLIDLQVAGSSMFKVTRAGNGTFAGTLAVTGAITATGGVTGALTGNVTGNLTGTVTGNASTATALATARAINGTNFDGTAAITVTAAAVTLTGDTLATNVLTSSLTAVGTITTGVWSGTAVAATKGGTGLTTYTAGDILYASATNVLSKLAKGTDGQFLSLASGLPAWASGSVPDPLTVGNIIVTDKIVTGTGTATLDDSSGSSTLFTVGVGATLVTVRAQAAGDTYVAVWLVRRGTAGNADKTLIVDQSSGKFGLGVSAGGAVTVSNISAGAATNFFASELTLTD